MRIEEGKKIQNYILMMKEIKYKINSNQTMGSVKKKQVQTWNPISKQPFGKSSTSLQGISKDLHCQIIDDATNKHSQIHNKSNTLPSREAKLRQPTRTNAKKPAT